MGGLIGGIWLFVGLIWAIAGKPFIEVAACFLIYGVCSGAYETYLLRRELKKEDKDE